MYKGQSLTIIREYFKANDVFNRVLAIEPNNVEAYINRGLATMLRKSGSFMNGNVILAVNSFNRALHFDPNNTLAHYYKGLALLKYNPPDYEGALQSFDKILEIQPDNTDALLGKAAMFAHLDNLAAEIDMYDQVLTV